MSNNTYINQTSLGRTPHLKSWNQRKSYICYDNLKIPEKQIDLAKSFKYKEFWTRLRIKIQEKLNRRKYKEIEIYESGIEKDIAGRIKRLESYNRKLGKTVEEIELIPSYLIHPKSKAKGCWSIIMVIALIYTATIMPYRIAFIDGVGYDTWFILDNILNIIFLIDFILTCFTAIYDQNQKLITNLWIIILNYLKGWMLIDFVSFCPFDLIIQSNSKSANYNNMIRLLRIPRMYRILKISKIIKYFKSKQQSNTDKGIFQHINLKESTLKFLGFFLTVITCAHLMTCLFYFAAKYNNFSSMTWIIRYNYLDKTPGEQYIASMYFTYTTLTTVGYGDITPGTNFEIVLTLLWMLFGVAFFSFTIGSLASMLSSADNK